MSAEELDDEQARILVEKVQAHAYPRRLRMKEFFIPFDPLRCGRCTKPQFARCLNQLQMRMSDAESSGLADYFTEHGANVIKPQNVNYAAFCDAVEAVYVEGSPSTEITSSPGQTMMSTFVPQSVEHEEQVMHILHRLATLCKTRGIIFKNCFTDCANAPIPNPSRMNPFMGGKCTVQQFIRYFPFQKDFSEGEMQIIVERYRTKDGDVHFQAIHNDISEVLSTELQPFPTSPLFVRPDSTQWSHDSMSPVQKIQAKVVEKRLRMYEHFQDFDPLRKGFCSVGQVKTVFTLLNIGKEIHKADFDKLAHMYMRDDGLFCYADFCADVDRAFAVPNLERDPLAQTAMPDPSTTAPARRNTMRLSASQEDAVRKLEDRLRTRVRLRRILIKPAFRDFDRPNRGFITRAQFARIMSMLQMELTEHEIATLCSVYCNIGVHNDFNYLDFCRSIDVPDADTELAMSQRQLPYQDFEPAKYFDDSGRVMPHESMAAFG